MRHENQGHTCIPAIWNRQLVWSGACTHRWAAGLESSCKQGLALTERIDLSLGLSIHLDTQKSHVAALTHHSPMLIPISHVKGQKQNMEEIRSRWKILGKVLPLVLDCTAPVGGCTILEASSSRCRAC